MPQRKTQVGNAGAEVLPETLPHRRQLALVGRDEVVRSAAASACAAAPKEPRARAAISGHWRFGALLRRLRSRWTRHR